MMNMPKLSYGTVRLTGGMDQVTPTLSLKPGTVRRGVNFEASLNGGYTRIAGYERFDGHANPSDATYTIIEIALTGTIAVGNTVTGGTSGATGKVIAVSGSDIIITRETGTFVAGESVLVSAVSQGTVTEVVGIDANGLTDAQYNALAAADYRTSISAVPGSGNVLGVQRLGSTVYAWRANAGNTAVDLYKSSAAGWVQVTLGKELSFTAGTTGLIEGVTVTGLTSGATGAIARVVVQTGTLGAGTAAGRLILSSTTGTFQAAESLRIAGVTKATASGAQTQITLAVGGRYQTVVDNFGAGVANARIYGCDGVNNGFEFDGTTYVPIVTGMASDIPTCVTVHKKHLFFAFGSSLQNSAIGNPYQWTPLLGATEIAMNNTITVLRQLPGDQTSGALAVYTSDNLSILYGSSSADFALAAYEGDGGGALAYSGQNVGQTYVMSNLGIVSVSTSQNFGNFATASLTLNIKTFVQAHRSLTSASGLNREKSQYRVFFSDGHGLYMTVVNGQLIGVMPVEFTNPVLCMCRGETTADGEVSYFGSSNGMVYRLDAGTSFDGEAIASNISLVPNAFGSPRALKRFRRASIEMTGDSYCEFDFGYDLSYRSTVVEQQADVTQSNDLRSAYYDEMTYDNFIYDGADLSPSEIELAGSGENLATRISSVSALFKPFTLNSIIFHYNTRRSLR